MSTVKRFEDLRAWQSARELVNLVYSASKNAPFDRDYSLKDQIRRSAISVMSNIAEGFGAGSDSEFIKFLGYARRSACETESQAYIALDQGYLDQKCFQKIYFKAVEIERQINALISYLHKSKRLASVKEEKEPYFLQLLDDE
jgi:four helix bundle protein